MTDSTIPPVFDAEKWQRVLAYQQLARERGLDPCAIVAHEPPEAVMAIANAALTDDDPRKITRAILESIRETLQTVDAMWYENVGKEMAFLAALESYLQPEGP